MQASGGSVVNAYNSILNAATQAVQQGNITGVFNNLPVTVAGQQIIVRGNAANGDVQIGTALRGKIVIVLVLDSGRQLGN